MVRGSREDFKVYKNVFDNFTERNLFKLITEGHFERLESPVKIGKESNIFTASRRDGSKVIVKIYRLQNANFNKMHEYISSDPRFKGVKSQKRKVIFEWVKREYRNLLKAREQVDVPTPYAFKDNLLVMEMIGRGEPAPQLKDAVPVDLEDFCRRVTDFVGRLWKAGLVHGDLSEFNILNFDEKPVFIDFSQSTIAGNPHALELLERDVANLVRFFKKHGLVLDKEAVLRSIQ